MSDDKYHTLSNGMRTYIGTFGDGSSEIAMIERMIAAGHVPATNDEGEVNWFFVEGHYCNGPGCSVCHDGCCQHCQPNWQPKPCPGAEKVEADRISRRRAEYAKLKAEFEPATPSPSEKGEKL